MCECGTTTNTSCKLENKTNGIKALPAENINFLVSLDYREGNKERMGNVVDGGGSEGKRGFTKVCVNLPLAIAPFCGSDPTSTPIAKHCLNNSQTLTSLQTKASTICNINSV